MSQIKVDWNQKYSSVNNTALSTNYADYDSVTRCLCKEILKILFRYDAYKINVKIIFKLMSLITKVKTI